MTRLYNEMIIQASIEKIWDALSNIEELEHYDPTVKRSVALSKATSGVGATRKVDMLDGKNWFEEKVTVFKQHEALTFELTACTFPIHGLTHSYTFEKIGHQTKVKQVMEYEVKFGAIGKILDVLMIRKQTEKGIQKFFSGLKSYIEKK
jgi:ribosome-associated toxin RatA of RatAB toxin-antitoxin module